MTNDQAKHATPEEVCSTAMLGPSCRSETGDVMLCPDAACGWVGRCVAADPMEPGAERDCQHGQLARACDRCADAQEIAELRKALRAMLYDDDHDAAKNAARAALAGLGA